MKKEDRSLIFWGWKERRVLNLCRSCCLRSVGEIFGWTDLMSIEGVDESVFERKMDLRVVKIFVEEMVLLLKIFFGLVGGRY